MLERQIQINQRTFKVHQDLSLSHAGTVWDGALVLIKYLDKNKEIGKLFFENKIVLQLGSGTGVTGLATLAFQPKHVFLTDMPQFVGILQENIINNKVKESSSALPLLWGNEEHLKQFQYIDTIVGSQLAYDKENAILLMKTINHFLKINPNLQILVSYQNTKEDYKNFEQLFKKYVGKEYKLASFYDMDPDYRDDYLRILMKSNN